MHERTNRGYGPLRISQELKQKGISDEISDEFLDERDPQWFELLQEIHRKKFGGLAPEDYAEQARQSRFLQYRGFTNDQIHRLFKKIKNHDD